MHVCNATVDPGNTCNCIGDYVRIIIDQGLLWLFTLFNVQ